MQETEVWRAGCGDSAHGCKLVRPFPAAVDMTFMKRPTVVDCFSRTASEPIHGAERNADRFRSEMARLPLELFLMALAEVRCQLSRFPRNKSSVGVDATVKVFGFSDCLFVGDGASTWAQEVESTRCEWASVKRENPFLSEMHCDFMIVSAAFHVRKHGYGQQ